MKTVEPRDRLAERVAQALALRPEPKPALQPPKPAPIKNSQE